MKWTKMKSTPMTLHQPAFCESPVVCRTGRTLVLLLVASLGAGWLSPTLAHSQATAEWTRTWCKAIGNCSSFYQFYRWRADSPGVFGVVTRSGIPMAPRGSNPCFALEPYRAFAIASKRLGQSAQLGFPSVTSRTAAPSITNDIWTGGPGNWSNGSMWSAGLPNSSDNALIDNGNSKVSTVTLDINATINNLTIDSDDSLHFNPGTSLAVQGGTISNAGAIVITGGSNANTILSLGASTILSGHGTVTLAYNGSGSGAGYIEQGAGGVTLKNVDNTIDGTGIIGNGGLTLINQKNGTIDANISGAGLTLNGSGGITNTGLLEATGSGILAINTAVNNAEGNITANGGTVEIVNADVQGGTLNTLNGGTLETAGTSILDGSTNGALTLSKTSTYTGNPGTVTSILGTITNNGNFQMTAGNNANTLFQLDGNTTLSGGGTVTLAYNGNGSGAAYILQNAGGLTLTNVNNTIEGTGIIGNGGLTLINKSGGKIDANIANAGLTLNGSGGVTNTGLLEATHSGILAISTTVNNAGGNVTANGGTVEVNADIQGGTLNALNGGTLETVGTSILDGSTNGALTLSKGSIYIGNPGTVTNVMGTITNNGTFQLTGGNNANTILGLNANTTLSGGGKVTLAYNGNGSGAAYILQNGGNLTLTNVNNTISGTGIIGNGTLTLVNQSGGTINANTSGAGLTLNGSGGVTNTGLLEATGGGVLAINTTVNNAGGNITANGGTVEVVSAAIQGGTLTNIGGTFETPGGASATLDGSTASGPVTLNGTYSGLENSITYTLGTINNKGTMLLIGGSNANTFLDIAANTTLQSGGTVTLAYDGNGSGAAYIQQSAGGLTLTNVNNTIQGEGVIGNGGLTLINDASGVINANSAGSPVAGSLTLSGSGGVTNLGLMEATKASTLVINTTVNNAGGNITANGGTVAVVNATVQGGTLNSKNGGILETGGSATLDGLTHGALTLSTGSTYTSNPGTNTYVLGTITDKGNIQVIGGNNANTILDLAGNTTLNGGGTVTLSYNGNGSGAAYIEQNAGGLTLTNQDTIQGAGVIGNGGLTLINATGGTLFANVPGQTLLIDGSGNITNDGTMRVASGSAMHVTSGPFTNFAGTTLTGGTYNVGGTLEIDELGSTGGEIVTNAANIILNGSSSSFIDAGGKDALANLNTNAKGSSFTITGGRNFTTVGKFTNNGTLTVGSATSTFKVNGNLTNFSTSTDTLTGGTYNLTGTLKFRGADIVTNAANITLSGSSSKIVDQHGNDGLANFARNSGTFTINNGRNFTTAGNFTNNGTLTVGSSNSTFGVKGNLTNFSDTTLTGGTYNLTGTLQFTGANIVTNAANITLNGTSSQIIDQNGKNGLANFATNNGTFALAGTRSFTTAGNFANTGTFTINTGSMFSLGGSGVFTQSAGTTTDNGTLAAPGAVNLQGGSLFGTGSITGSVQSSGTVTPGDSSALTGILTDTGTYTQKSKGNLDISIGGTTAGSQFDELNSTSASLNGTLNIGLINGFVPTIGSKFKIMNFTSETGTFSTVNGLTINNKEHFTITYQGKDVLLTVVSGAAPAGQRSTSHFFPGTTRQPAMFGRFGGIFDDLSFGAGNRDLVGRVENLFHPSLTMARTGLVGPGRVGLATSFRAMSPASGPLAFSEAFRRANYSEAQFRVSSGAPRILASSAFRQVLAISHSGLMTNAVNFASVRGASLGDNFRAAGANGLRGVNPGVSSPTRWGIGNLPATRINSGGSALRGRGATGNFAVSLSNITSKPKFGLAIQ
jgi:fibronectin-binding autotransporter adhesin